LKRLLLHFLLFKRTLTVYKVLKQLQIVVNIGFCLFKFGWSLVIIIRVLRFRADFFLDGLELLISKLFAFFKECIWRLFFLKIDV
jgi:hypothetical protein